MSTRGISFQESKIMIQSLTNLSQIIFSLSLAVKNKNRSKIHNELDFQGFLVFKTGLFANLESCYDVSPINQSMLSGSVDPCYADWSIKDRPFLMNLIGRSVSNWINRSQLQIHRSSSFFSTSRLNDPFYSKFLSKCILSQQANM